MTTANTKAKAKTGTREWSEHSDNCVLGCSHRCRYCYARHDAVVRWHNCPSHEAWGTSYFRVAEKQVKRRRHLLDGRVMFPTTHDIEPAFLNPCLAVIEKLLEAGNELLIVSKPHLECIKEICRRCRPYRQQITFRFSIGTTDEELLRYWEPGAPTFHERWCSLEHAWRSGYRTSVSAEPLLDASLVDNLIREIEGYVSDSIWIGKLNQLEQRVIPGTDPEQIQRIADGQTDRMVMQVYQRLGKHPLIRWKDSYREVIDRCLSEDGSGKGETGEKGKQENGRTE